MHHSCDQHKKKPAAKKPAAAAKKPKQKGGGDVLTSIKTLAIPFGLMLAQKGVDRLLTPASTKSKSKPKSKSKSKPVSKTQRGGVSSTCATLRGGTCNCNKQVAGRSTRKTAMRGGEPDAIDAVMDRINALTKEVGNIKIPQ